MPKTKPLTAKKSLKADANVNYPIVDKLEDTTFNKEFKSLDINKRRLANLEQKTFNKTYDKDSLNDRVERLKGSNFKPK